MTVYSLVTHPRPVNSLQVRWLWGTGWEGAAGRGTYSPGTGCLARRWLPPALLSPHTSLSRES